MNKEILSIKNLKIGYETESGLLIAVNSVNLNVYSGETLAIIGESGSGKSTLALSILRLLPSNAKIISGSIEYSGVNLLSLTDEEMRKIRGNKIAYIPQEPSTALNPSFTVYTFLKDVVYSHRFIEKKELKKYLIDVLKKVRIPNPEKFLNFYPFELSGGMKQRILIAASLLNNPNLLIADEPTSALDVSVQAQILALISSLKKEFNMSIIFITHNLSVAAQIADRIAIMYAGKVLEIGDINEIYENPAHPYTQGLLSSVPRLQRTKRLRSIPGFIPNLTNPPSGCIFHPRCPYIKEKCKKFEPKKYNLSNNHEVYCWLYGE
jgi:oligopeptide/dipeptide ABC transporter ATP-binding protein